MQVKGILVMIGGERLASPTRANWLFLVCLLALGMLGAPLQRGLGLSGLVISELLVFLLLPLGFARAVESTPVREVFRLRMLTPLGIVKCILLGVTGWLTGQSMGLVAVFVVQRLGGSMPDMYSTLLSAPFWTALLVGALVPAICEEMAFRGYVQWGLGPLGARAAVVLTGLMFGLMHLSLVRFAPLALLGIVFSVAVQRTGSVLAGIIMHLVNNATALSLVFYARTRLMAPVEVGLIPPGALVIWLVGGAGAALATWGLLSTLTTADAVGTRPAAEPPKGERLPLWAEFVPFVPALYLFALWSRYELLRVFGGR